MGKCPRGLKTCEQKFIKHYADNDWLCFGIMERKGPGGVKMDCIRHCMKTFFHKKPKKVDSTPDEALVMAAGYSHTVHEWLDEFEPFGEWRDENDR